MLQKLLVHGSCLYIHPILCYAGMGVLQNVQPTYVALSLVSNLQNNATSPENRILVLNWSQVAVGCKMKVAAS